MCAYYLHSQKWDEGIGFYKYVAMWDQLPPVPQFPEIDDSIWDDWN
jgi:hypothetical protein